MNRVIFLEEGSMQLVHAMEMEAFETAISCMACTVTLTEDEGAVSREIVVVGTAFTVPEEYESSRGRLLVFELGTEAQRRVTLVTQRDVKGAVYTLGELDGKVLAGIGSKVQLFKWIPREDPTAPPDLQPDASHKGFILALYIKIYGEFIIVGDLMRSMILLHYRAVDGALVEVARDYNVNYMRAVEALNEDYYLGCEDLGNLFVVRRQAEAVAEEERTRMDLQAEMHLGDCINVLRHGSLNRQPAESSDTDALGGIGQTAVLYGTVSGGLGSILSLSESAFRFFSSMERSVNLVISGVGGFAHSEWRSFSNNRRQAPQRNFVDGDIVEMFLDLPSGDMALVVRHLNDDLAGSGATGLTGLPLAVEDVIRRVEDMVRMH